MAPMMPIALMVTFTLLACVFAYTVRHVTPRPSRDTYPGQPRCQ